VSSSNGAGLRGRVAVVTGGYGVLGGSMADGLAAAGAKVAVLGRHRDAAEAKAAALRDAGGEAMPLVADVLDEPQLRAARAEVLAAWGRVDILVNAAGGNVPAARTDHAPPFVMPLPAFDEVVRLNLHGTVYPTLVFGEAMAGQKRGAVVNVSSMAATQAVSGVFGYSAAKAAIENFTRWLAVDLARRGWCGRADRARPHHPGPHADGPLRRPGRPAGARVVALQRGRRVRDRSRHPGGRRVQRRQRHLTLLR
jgi:NAD(P)-dependent dehydrogenase (short-subunit alcohol dehydrogenase family)